jgi:hypothetical protein
MGPARQVQASTRPRPLVSSSSATSGRCLQVGGLGPANEQWSPAGRGSTLGPVKLAPFFFHFFFLLPSTVCACGQLLLIGSDTCPPWPDLAQKLQTPINFDL